MSDELSLADVERLMRKPTPIQKMAEWPTPDEKEAITQAIREHKNFVELRNRTFTISNRGEFGYWVSPLEAQLPCGYFR